MNVSFNASQSNAVRNPSAQPLSNASAPTPEIVTSPVSSTVTSVSVASWMPRIVLPLGPIRSPIFSWLIWIVTMRGAYLLMSLRGSARCCSM